MSNQHRATPEQWQAIEANGHLPTRSTILELHYRVEALEAAAKPAQPNYPAKPDGSLVKQVASAIHPSICADPNLYLHEARAAIRAVAAALLEWHDSDQVVHTAWEAAKWLQQEAER